MPAGKLTTVEEQSEWMKGLQERGVMEKDETELARSARHGAGAPLDTPRLQSERPTGSRRRRLEFSRR